MKELLDFNEYENYQKALKKYEEEQKAKEEFNAIKREQKKGLDWCKKGDDKLKYL